MAKHIAIRTINICYIPNQSHRCKHMHDIVNFVNVRYYLLESTCKL